MASTPDKAWHVFEALEHLVYTEKGGALTVGKRT